MYFLKFHRSVELSMVQSNLFFFYRSALPKESDKFVGIVNYITWQNMQHINETLDRWIVE